MQTFGDISSARNAIMDFRADHGKDIPENMMELFRNLSASPSPVDQIVSLGELFYARRADLPVEAANLGAGLIAFATANGWHGLLDGDRGNGMVRAFRRDSGEAAPAGYPWPAAADDPAPSPAYAAPIAPPVAPASPQPAPPAPAPAG